MTDQKHAKEPKVGEKIWVEMIVTYYDKETKLIRIDPLSSPHVIGEALVNQGSFVSRHSPFDLLQQLDKLREALEFYANKENFTFREFNGKPGFEADIIKKHCEINGKPAWAVAEIALAKLKKSKLF